MSSREEVGVVVRESETLDGETVSLHFKDFFKWELEDLDGARLDV